MTILRTPSTPKNSLPLSLLPCAAAAVLALAGCAHTQKAAAPAPAAPTVVGLAQRPSPRAAAAAAAPEGEAPSAKMEVVYFDYDSYELRREALPELAEVGQELKADPARRIRIEGNCDERGTEAYNLALGEQRAQVAKRYLMQLGIPGDRIATLSYGSLRPKLQGHDETAWSKNRRDDFVRQ
jgi:peptidoglycan-associated lipoprotein